MKIFNIIPQYFLIPLDFMTGEIYQMAVTSRSHVKKPYYVIIKKVTPWSITTDIPGYHSLEIPYGSEMWKYHIPRMKYIGSNKKSKQLIYNQKTLIPE